MSRSLDQVLALHRAAAAEVAAAAEGVPAERWARAIAEGRWSPEQVLDHLIATYDVVLRELAGSGGMEVRTRPLQRLLLRLVLVPRLLRGRPFPAGARAPREIRPAGRGLARGETIALFRQRAGEIEQAARAAAPEQRITHAYFGAAAVADGVLLVTRHLQHHRAQLPSGG